ncbi:ABC transporter substrate-binding protein [Clostridiaceae bacterium UIB06]|uniref:ABC transporter substrate-binding protein n=1 Tax=Clostridium thailandense TaxID=2794346 RepID=A0A949TTD2_9CLOT|nr:ABC transporter substrate-binding protein [Clostridium thailandense]MBV7272003.1 ABC transporter substrate-binding protein [Clostridium thailandense]MCH5136821.1 ABC transporter substrate-binding protein [Clostridiaceae bacterium UIB06]
MKKQYKIITMLFIVICSFITVLNYSSKIKTKNGSVFGSFHRSDTVKRLVVGRSSDAITLDPSNMTDIDSIKVTANIFETLVKYEREGKEIKPGLAVDWKCSEDGLTWVFKLRQGVKFHDETDFNAQSVVFNFQRWMDINNPYHKGQFSYWNYVFGGFPGFVKSVVALSDYTVEIKLSKPYAPFLSTLTMPIFSIESPEAIKKYGTEVYKHPVGTGPFCFKSWNPNDNILLVRNNGYWYTNAKVDEVEFKVIPLGKDRLDQLKKGTIHIADNLSPDDTLTAERDGKLQLFLRPCFNVGYMAMNNEKTPFNNRQVRTAISYAINKDELIKEAFDNIAKPAKTFIPPMFPGYNESIEPIEYNIEKSIELLKEAGYPQGFKTTLEVMECSRNYFPRPLQVAQYIKESLKKVNIEVNIKTYSWDEYLKRIRNGEHELALIGWTGDNIDPDNFLNTLLSSDNAKLGIASNYSFYKNKEIDTLLTQARETNDMVFRKNLYKKLLGIVNYDMPAIPLAHTMPVVATSLYVEGYSPYITGVESLESVDIKQ